MLLPMSVISCCMEAVNMQRARQWLEDAYGSADGLSDALERTVLLLRTSPVVIREPTVVDTLECIAYCGACGGDIAEELRRTPIPDLLTRFVAALLRYAADLECCDDVLRKAALASANCCGGAARHMSDLSFTVDGTLRVVLGFADYATSETAARLWAGAILLSLWLREKDIISSWLSFASTALRRPIRVLEIGCGPALLSAMIAELAKDTVNACGGEMTLHVTDVVECAVREALRTITERNARPLPPWLVVEAYMLDMGAVPDSLAGQFDVVVASDIVYDHSIAALVGPALERVLCPQTGVAYVCCESHRDGMATFVDTIRRSFSDSLAVECIEAPIALERHKPPAGTNELCTLMVFRRL